MSSEGSVVCVFNTCWRLQEGLCHCGVESAFSSNPQQQSKWAYFPKCQTISSRGLANQFLALTNHVLREHEFHFVFCSDQFFVVVFSPVTYKVLHLLNGFSGLWCPFGISDKVDILSFLSSVWRIFYRPSFLGVCFISWRSFSNHFPPNEEKKTHIWQKLPCCLATDLLYYCGKNK